MEAVSGGVASVVLIYTKNPIKTSLLDHLVIEQERYDW